MIGTSLDRKVRSMDRMTEANQRVWDGLAEIHYRNYHIDRLLAGEHLLNEVIRGEVGDVEGSSPVD